MKKALLGMVLLAGSALAAPRHINRYRFGTFSPTGRDGAAGLSWARLRLGGWILRSEPRLFFRILEKACCWLWRRVHLSISRCCVPPGTISGVMISITISGKTTTERSFRR